MPNRLPKLVLQLTILLAASSVSADPDIAGAKKYNDAAGVALAHKEYEEAAAGYVKANSLAEAPGVMLNAAQAYRLAAQQGAEEKNAEKASRNRDLAREWYKKYLDTRPDEDKELVARGWLAKLDAQWAEEHPKEEAERQRKAQAVIDAKIKAERDKQLAIEKRDQLEKAHVEEARRDEQNAKARTVRIVGLSVMGGGVVAAGIGIAFGLKARSLSNDLSSDKEYDTGRIQQGQDANRDMKICYLAGGTLLIGGAITYLFGRVIENQIEQRHTSLSIVPTDGGTSFAVIGTF